MRSGEARRAAAPAPDGSALLDLVGRPVDLRAIALTGIFSLGVLYTLYFARDFLLPIVVAILLGFLLSPPVGWLESRRLPRPLAAALVLLALLAVLGFGLSRTLGPAREWVTEAPTHLTGIERKLRRILRPVAEVSEAAKQVEELTAAAGGQNEAPVEVQSKPSLRQLLFANTQKLVASAGVMLVLLYFLLVSGDLFLRKLVRVLPRMADKRRAVEIARQIQSDISTHLATITLINACLGLLVALALRLVGLPNPLLWGALAAILNFVPYLGAFVGVLLVAAASLLAFEDVGRALAAPAVYLALTSIEGALLTPIILGHRLALNPVVIFVGLFFWGWIWGIPGALLAVPMLLATKIFCDNIAPLAPIGEFLGR